MFNDTMDGFDVEGREVILGILREEILDPGDRVFLQLHAFLLDVAFRHPVLYRNVSGKCLVVFCPPLQCFLIFERHGITSFGP